MKNAKTNTRARRLPRQAPGALIGAAALLVLSPPRPRRWAPGATARRRPPPRRGPRRRLRHRRDRRLQPRRRRHHHRPDHGRLHRPRRARSSRGQRPGQRGPGASGVFGALGLLDPHARNGELPRARATTSSRRATDPPGEEACLRGRLRTPLPHPGRRKSRRGPRAPAPCCTRPSQPAAAAQRPAPPRPPPPRRSDRDRPLRVRRRELRRRGARRERRPRDPGRLPPLHRLDRVHPSTPEPSAREGSSPRPRSSRTRSSKLPPGLVGNPRRPHLHPGSSCSAPAVATNCPPESQVGTAGHHRRSRSARFDAAPPPARRLQHGRALRAAATDRHPGPLRLQHRRRPIQVYAECARGEDYGVTVIAKNVPQTLPVERRHLHRLGRPRRPRPRRGALLRRAAPPVRPSGCRRLAAARPFLTLPTSCTGPVQTTLDVTSWQGWLGSSASSHATRTHGGTGCPAVPFEPTLEARPTTNVADAPAGLDVDLTSPRDDDPERHRRRPPQRHHRHPARGPGGQPLRRQRPRRLLAGQFGFTSTDPDEPIHTTPDPATCPDASKIGTVEVDTPLLDHPLRAPLYLADPFDNPFDSLLALYIAVDDPQTGIVVKLAGEVTPDPDTGRLTTTFEHNPQLPFEHFRLHFFGGAGGALRTPAICGNYTTTSSLTPWSAPDGGSPRDEPTPGRSPRARRRRARPGDAAQRPVLRRRHGQPDRGAPSPPSSCNLRREDGSQHFSAVTVDPAAGPGRQAGRHPGLLRGRPGGGRKQDRASTESSQPELPGRLSGRHRRRRRRRRPRPLPRPGQGLPRRPLQRRPAEPGDRHPGDGRPLRPRHRGRPDRPARRPQEHRADHRGQRPDPHDPAGHPARRPLGRGQPRQAGLHPHRHQLRPDGGHRPADLDPGPDRRRSPPASSSASAPASASNRR